MNVRRRYVLIAVIALVAGLILYLVFSNSIRDGEEDQKFTLNVWGVEDETVFASVASGYQALRPGATIAYKELDPGTYKEIVLNALAEGSGPDVLYVKNHDIPADHEKLYPARPEQFNLARLNDLFPVVVGQDMVASGSQLYALPLYVDTLALLYNRDLFDQAAIVYPPKTWAEFQNLVPKLTKLNDRGQLAKSAAAIGGAERTVDAGVDLLIALMMQRAPRTADAGDRGLPETADTQAGVDALTFYLQFTDPASTAYTWNGSQANSIDSFSAGKTAMLLNYQSAVSEIRKKNPFARIGVAPLPQASGESDAPVTYASYYALAVSKQSKIPTWAWDFVIQATTSEAIARSYLASAGRPPALKALIAEKIGDPELTVFAESALIARSWHHVDNQAIHSALNDAIRDAMSGKSSAREALETASARINYLYR